MDSSQPRGAVLDEADDFAAAVEPHLPVLGRVTGRLGPRGGRREDVLQEALLRAWAHRRQYDPHRAPLLTWLLTIVANEARRAAGRRNGTLPVPMTANVAEPATDERLDLETATKKLPEPAPGR